MVHDDPKRCSASIDFYPLAGLCFLGGLVLSGTVLGPRSWSDIARCQDSDLADTRGLFADGMPPGFIRHPPVGQIGPQLLSHCGMRSDAFQLIPFGLLGLIQIPP